MLVLLLFLQVKPALWKTPLPELFCWYLFCTTCMSMGYKKDIFGIFFAYEFELSHSISFGYSIIFPSLIKQFMFVAY